MRAYVRGDYTGTAAFKGKRINDGIFCANMICIAGDIGQTRNRDLPVSLFLLLVF